MKRFILILVAVAFSGAMMAQPDVTSAYNANKSGDYAKAAEYIEKAITIPKAAGKEKTWRYRGMIYLNISQAEELKDAHPEALEKSFDSFKKALEIDPDGGYSQDCKVFMGQVQTVAMDAGITKFTAEDYVFAAGKFSLSKDISAYFDVVDTLAIWNTALCYDKAGDWEKAVDGYRVCADMGYQEPNVHLFIANLQQENEDIDGALKTLEDALIKFPTEQGLLIEQLNIYLRQGKFEEAEANLKKAAANDPENEVLWFSLGSVYDNLSRYEEAEEAYKEALIRNPDYFEANYNIGALYFNRAVSMVNDANAIPTNQNSKYKAAIAESNLVFELALPYLENAYVLNPEDKETMRSLKDIYVRMNNDEKYQEMKTKLGE
jgi:tetratricopeptide (TPR) repeat protein